MAESRCGLLGHKFSLWKEGGESYMKCDYCPAVRVITADDIKPIPDFDDRPQRKPMAPFEYDMDDFWGFGG